MLMPSGTCVTHKRSIGPAVVGVRMLSLVRGHVLADYCAVGRVTTDTILCSGRNVDPGLEIPAGTTEFPV